MMKIYVRYRSWSEHWTHCPPPTRTRSSGRAPAARGGPAPSPARSCPAAGCGDKTWSGPGTPQTRSSGSSARRSRSARPSRRGCRRRPCRRGGCRGSTRSGGRSDTGYTGSTRAGRTPEYLQRAVIITIMGNVLIITIISTDPNTSLNVRLFHIKKAISKKISRCSCSFYLQIVFIYIYKNSFVDALALCHLFIRYRKSNFFVCAVLIRFFYFDKVITF